jgi:hypothetical protein
VSAESAAVRMLTVRGIGRRAASDSDSHGCVVVVRVRFDSMMP